MSFEYVDISNKQLSSVSGDYLKSGVKGLNAASNKLTTFPKQLLSSSFSSLVALNLSNNQIADFPSDINAVEGLKFLHLGFNKIPYLPTEIYQLSNLKILILDNNQLTKFPEGVMAIYNLEELSLNDNLIPDVNSGIQKLSSLKILSMARNCLSGRLPMEIWMLPSLVWASFSMNQITSLTPESFSLSLFNVSPIEHLFADFNKLSSFPVFPTLKTVHAKYNEIQSIPTEMANLQNLEELELEGNPLPARVAKMAMFSENFVNYLKSPKYDQDLKESHKVHDDNKTDTFLSYATSEWLDLPPGSQQRELIAGTVYNLSIQAINYYGVPQQSFFDQFSAFLLTHNNEIPCEIKESEKGKYIVTIKPTLRGLGILTVKKDNTHILGSPWDLVILPGPTKASNCEVVGMVDAMRCLPSVFYVVAKDIFANQKISGGDNIYSSISESSHEVQPIPIVTSTKDMNDGTYAIEFTPSILGRCKIEVSVNDKILPNSPFTIQIGPGPTSSILSSVDLNPLCNAFAGSDCYFIIIPKDSFHNVQPRIEGEIFAVAFTGPAPIQAQVIQGPTGTHKVSFHPTVSGQYSAQVSLLKSDSKLSQIGGSPFLIDIVAGPVVAQNCKTNGKGLENGRVGEESIFKIFAFDKYSNPIKSGGDRFDIKITGAVSLSFNAMDSGDGSYTASYNITKAATYKISISVNGAQITGSPFTVTLAEGDTHPSKTTITAATNDGTCGVDSNFIINAHDMYGNPRKKGGDKFSVSLIPPQSDKAVGVVKGEVKDNGNGTYQVTYNASVSGMYQGEVVLSDYGNIAGSPFRVKQIAGPPSAPKCALQGQSQQNGTAGIASEMVVILRDQFGNECENSNAATLDIKITAKDDKNNMHVVPATLKDNKNGTLAIGYSPTISGAYTIAINVVLKGSNKGNGPIAGSPFIVNVAPGPCDPSKVEIYTVGGRDGVLPVGKCTAPFVFGIRAVDKFGNSRKSGRDSFRVQMSLISSSSGSSSSSSVNLQGLITDNNDGTYTASLTPTASGNYSIQVIHENSPIKFSPFSVTVEAGPTEASACTASFQEVAVVTAGVPAMIQIKAKDAFSNTRMSGGDRFIAVLHPKSLHGQSGKDKSDSIYANIVDCSNGTYDVSFTAFIATEMILHVTLEKGSSQHINGSPFTIKVDSGPVDVSKCDTTSLVTSDPGKELLFQAGVPFNFIVTARDPYGNKTKKGTDKMSVLMQGGSSSIPSQLSLVDNNDGGSFTVSHVVEQSGKFYVSILVDQMPIHGCPFTVFINGGPSYAPNCSASGPGLSSASSGAVSFFVITTKDKYNNIRTVSDPINTFNARAQYLNQIPAPPPIAARVLDNKDGTYRVEYTPTVAGDCEIYVTLSGANSNSASGMHIFGSPFKTKIIPGLCFPAKCEAFGAGLQGARAGQNVEFTIQTRDYYSNLLDSGGFLWQVKVKSPSDSYIVSPMVQDKRDGTYFCSFQPTLAGKYMITVTGTKDGSPVVRDEDGIHVVGSPFRILITPADASPYTSKLVGEGARGGFSGELNHFKVHSCDEFDNQLLVGGDIYDIKVTGPTTPHVLSTDNNDGSYLVKFLANKSGTYLIHVNLKGIAVPGSPFRCLIEDKPNSITGK